MPNSVIGQTEALELASTEERAALPVALPQADLVFTGSTFFRKNAPIKLALVEPVTGAPYLFADVNQSGSFELEERFSFEGATQEVLLKVPLSEGPYHYYPIRLLLPEHYVYIRDSSGKAGATGRTLLRSPFALVEGTVDIGGQRTLVRYMFDLEKNNAYPDWGWQGMDANGDGRIDERGNSEEWTFAHDESVVFDVNGREVVTTSLDLKAGTFVVREHAAGENQRISLRLGARMPEFSFTDFDGRLHRFSDFRGRYVLLDFWATWCGPCRMELPDLEKAYQQFRSRGFVVLGMDDSGDAGKSRRILADAGVTYPQSGGAVGANLVNKRFRVDVFPTKVLVNPESKIIAVGDDGLLDREHMISALEKLLPPAK